MIIFFNNCITFISIFCLNYTLEIINGYIFIALYFSALMHKHIISADSWRIEILRDDSDAAPPQNVEEALLNGCSFIEEVRESGHYTAVVRYAEHSRRNVTVEGIVWRRNGTPHHHKSLEDAVFLEEKEFDIPGSELAHRREAYGYANQLKEHIVNNYFLSTGGKAP